MGATKLEMHCPTTLDPNPDWSIGDLLSELNLLESKLNASPLNPRPCTKFVMRENVGTERRELNKKPFVMRVSNNEIYESDSEDDTDRRSLVPVRHFGCSDVYFSDSDESEDDSLRQLQVPLLEKMEVAEGAFLQLTHEYQHGIKDKIRDQISAWETELVAEKEKSRSSYDIVKKNTEARREIDRKLDLHYQRKIAEALDNHMTAIQRDHEHRSQIEERRIRDDAAFEEAKRKEKALQEERLRQQKAKAEEEARREAAKRAEEERKASQEAERIAKSAAKLAREELVKDATNPQMRTLGQKEDSRSTLQNVPSSSFASNVPNEPQPTGNLVVAAPNALKLEERRIQKYKEVEEKNESISPSSHKVVHSKERLIARVIKQISGSVDNVRSKANELLKVFNDPLCPQPVTVAIFAKKVISISETPNANFNTFAFACGHVIVSLSTQVPIVMDCLLAELNQACIYTVPKHIRFIKSAYETKEAYFKTIGYREEDGTIETTDQYLERLRSYMKLYAAVIQTEAQGAQNINGLEEGWIWLARFLNALPANVYTAVALEAFLTMAGFALHRKYKSQFEKMLKVISQHFLHALKKRGDEKVSSVITRIEHYIQSKEFKKKPEGRDLQVVLLSRNFDT